MELTLLVTAELFGAKKHLSVIQRELELIRKLLATYTKEREMPEKV